MKSIVFKNAWNLVKDLGITFSSALVIAWGEAKLDKLTENWIIENGKAFNYKKVNAIEIAMAIETKKVNAIKPCYFCYNSERSERSNAGAAYYYGVGRYNGD